MAIRKIETLQDAIEYLESDLKVTQEWISYITVNPGKTIPTWDGLPEGTLEDIPYLEGVMGYVKNILLPILKGEIKLDEKGRKV